jgi:hypothetical protein
MGKSRADTSSSCRTSLYSDDLIIGPTMPSHKRSHSLMLEASVDATQTSRLQPSLTLFAFSMIQVLAYLSPERHVDGLPLLNARERLRDHKTQTRLLIYLLGDGSELGVPERGEA